MDNKIKAIEEYTKGLWEMLQVNYKLLEKQKEFGMKKEARETQEFIGRARARWAAADTILRYLKDEITEEYLK